MDAKKLEILMTAVDLGSFSRASEVRYPYAYVDGIYLCRNRSG